MPADPSAAPAADEPRTAPLVPLLAADLLARMSYGLARTPALPLYAAALGAGPREIGIIGAAATCVGLVLKFPSGVLSDVVGRRPLLLAGLFVFAAGPWLYPIAGGLLGLLLVRVFHGLATAIYSPVSMSAVAAISGERRGEMLSWLSNTKIAGALLGSLAGGWLLSAGSAPDAHVATTDFRLAWGVAGILGIAAFVAGARVAADPRVAGRGGGKHGLWTKLRAGLRETSRNGALLLVSATEGLQNISVGMLEQFLPIYAVLAAGLSPFEAGALFGVQTASAILCKPLFGRVSDRIATNTTRRPLIVAGLVACAVPFLLLPWVTTFWPLAALCVVFGVGEALVTAAASALAADVAEREGLGAAMGAFGTIGDAGHAAGPILGGFLLAATDGRGPDSWAAESFRLPFGAVGVLLLVTAALFPFVRLTGRPA